MNTLSFITRKKKSDKEYDFFYNNKKVTDKKILEKVYKIYIPPAYNDVKIYLDNNIVATGIDKLGRKQYIYSEHMKQLREEKKYCQLIKLSLNIKKLKNKINKDLLNKSFTKNKLIALILKIMDLCNFRNGNKKYEEKYGSHGLTTLYKKHFIIKNDNVTINFIGKKGVQNNCIIKNKSIQNIIKKIYDKNIDKDNKNYIFYPITIYDVNKYLEKFNVSSKDLRTWNANIIFLKNFKKEISILDFSLYNEYNEKKKLNTKKKLIREAINKTAISLHHTPSICKSSYIFKNLLNDIEKDDSIINKLKTDNIIIEDFLKNLLLKDKMYKKCKN